MSQGFNTLSEVTKDIVKEIAEQGESDEEDDANNSLRGSSSKYYEDELTILREENTQLKAILSDKKDNDPTKDDGKPVDQDQVENLRQRLNMMKKEKEGYRKKLKRLKANDQVSSIRSALAASEKEKNSLITKLNQSKKDFAKREGELRETILELEKRPGTSKIDQSLNSELESLRAFRLKIQAEGGTEEETRKTVEKLIAEKKVLERERVELKLKIDMLKDNLQTFTQDESKLKLESIAAEHEKINAKLQQELKSSKSAYEKLQKEYKGVTIEVEELRTSNQSFNLLVQDLQAKLVKAEIEQAKLKELEMLHSDADKTHWYETSIQELREQNKTLQLAADEAKQRFYTFKSSLLSALKGVKGSLVLQVNNASNRSSGNDSQDSVDEMISERQKLLEEVGAKVKELDSLKAKLKDQCDVLESTRSDLEAERQAVVAKQAENDAQVKKLALLENKLADRDRDFLSLEGKCLSLEGQVQRSKQLENLVDQQETVEMENQKLENEMRAACKHMGAPFPETNGSAGLASHLLSSCSALRRRVEQYKNELESRDKQNNDLLEQHSALQTEYRNLISKSDEVELACDEREMEVATLTERVEELEEELEQARMSTQDFLEEERQISDELRARCTELEEENRRLGSRAKELKKTVDEKAKESYLSDQTAAEKQTDMSRRMEIIMFENKTLKESLRKKHEQIVEQTSSKDNEITRLSREVTHLKLEYDALESFSKDYSQVKAELAEKIDQLDKAQRALQNLEALMSDGQVEKVQLQDKIEEVTSKKEEADFKLQRAIEAAKRSDNLQREVQSLRSRQTQSSSYILKLSKENDTLKRLLNEYTMSKLNPKPDEFQVDRRIINKLLVTFVERFHAGHNSDEVLTVMSNILSFSKEERDKIGLSRARAPSSIFWGLTSAFIPSRSPSQKKLLNQASEKNIADLWVNFLLSEANANEPSEMTSSINIPTPDSARQSESIRAQSVPLTDTPNLPKPPNKEAG